MYIEFSCKEQRACLSYYISFLFRKPDSIGRDIERKCNPIFPLHDVFVRKVKVLKKPKFECKLYNNQNIVLLVLQIMFSVGRLLEMHGEGTTRSTGSGGTTGTKIEREDYEPPVQSNV